MPTLPIDLPSYHSLLKNQIMKWNWGTGVAIFLVLFASSMIFAVVSTTRYPPQLVQKDYYALDMNYQARLEQKQNTAQLPRVPKIQYVAAQRSIQVDFPEGMMASQGTVKCFRSSTTKDDFTTSFQEKNTLLIPAEALKSGRWHVELEWEADGKLYFWETALFL